MKFYRGFACSRDSESFHKIFNILTLLQTWRSQVEKESKSVSLKKEDAKNRARWRVGVGEIAGRVG